MNHIVPLLAVPGTGRPHGTAIRGYGVMERAGEPDGFKRGIPVSEQGDFSLFVTGEVLMFKKLSAS